MKTVMQNLITSVNWEEKRFLKGMCENPQFALARTAFAIPYIQLCNRKILLSTNKLR